MKNLNIYIIAGLLSLLSGCSDDKRPEGNAPPQSDILKSIETTPISPFTFDQVSEVFLIGSTSTDLQRDKMRRELIGKTIEWTIPIYEISAKDNGVYLVTTESNFSGKSHLTAWVFITARDDHEREYLSALKSNDNISFKGILSDINLRLMLTVSPAILTKINQVPKSNPSKQTDSGKNESTQNTSRWTQIGGSNGLEVATFVDISSIRNAGNKAKIWRMDSYNKKTNVDFNFSSSVYMSEFDCQAAQTRVISDNYYSGTMGTGDPVQVDNNPTPWVEVIPNTVGSRAMRIACGEERGK